MQPEQSKLRQFFVKTPLYFFLLKLRSIYEYRAVKMVNRLHHNIEPRTAYCISPYKAGTTYVTGMFKDVCRVAHEPLHYTTLRYIASNDFLSKRKRFLNLEIECSGFFAGRLGQVRVFAPNAPILMMSRAPENWIGSVINYFRNLSELLSYNYVARLFFDPICGQRVENFYDLNPLKQAGIVTSLLEYWIRVYKEGKRDHNTLIIPLEDIAKHIEQIEAFLGYKSNPVRDLKWKRVNPKKRFFCLRDHIDVKRYGKDVSAIGYLM